MDFFNGITIRKAILEDISDCFNIKGELDRNKINEKIKIFSEQIEILDKVFKKEKGDS